MVLIRLLYGAFDEIQTTIDVAGDGIIPSSAALYMRSVPGADIAIPTHNEGTSTPENQKMKWSEMKDVVEGLIEYMIAQENREELLFLVMKDEAVELSVGRIWKKELGDVG